MPYILCKRESRVRILIFCLEIRGERFIGKVFRRQMGTVAVCALGISKYTLEVYFFVRQRAIRQYVIELYQTHSLQFGILG